MKIVKHPRPPAGLRRPMFRSPIWIYRVGPGAVFGRRLLLLNHIGRRTGTPRKTILEVVQYYPTDRSYVVASGWGLQAAWYRNILEQPEVSVEVGNSTIPVTAEPLAEESAPKSSPATLRGVPGSQRSHCRGCWACPLTGPTPTSEPLGDECRSCA